MDSKLKQGTNDDLVLLSPSQLEWRGSIYPCLSGRGGIRSDKREGDGATPVGRFPLRQVFYRPDRVTPFRCKLPMFPITQNDGWCDDPLDSLYNQFVTLPYSGRHEKLWRDDNVYDIIVVVGHNDAPAVPEMGSAIFIHNKGPQSLFTEGCVALDQEDLIGLLQKVRASTQLVVLGW